MESQDQIVVKTPDHQKHFIRRLIQVTTSLLFTMILLFVSAGALHWLSAWILFFISIIMLVINYFIFLRELISERGMKKENVEQWDKILTRFMIPLWVAVYLVAGLDHRFGWTHQYAFWIQLMGLCLFILGNAMVSWAMVSNTYFSTVVRIQYDRRHQVTEAGPYQWIRHPGYLGMIVYHCFTPVLLGALWALIPAFLISILFMLRTIWEDETLKSKLDGYPEYSRQVKYRLFPLIW
jgi:protein-S-isoprenylcysteine O-methyltransferase Ste14